MQNCIRILTRNFNEFTKGCRFGEAPDISLSLRRTFDGGILAIVGVKFIAAIGGLAINKHRPNSYSVNRSRQSSLSHPYHTSNMADAASGSADKSVQVKLVLLGALSESLINPFGS